MTWREDAACAGDLTFGEHIDLARETCQGCPVRAECHAWAKGERDFDGVAGGVVWRPSRPGVARSTGEEWAWEDARTAHSAWYAGDRSEWALEGHRAYDRQRKRKARLARAAA